ncbi:MoaD/ThiS family protein [Sphingosinicella rhizophila]|uniref:MoaD/ThiS family protein n=1 Tax=Sphingosinicella rhizophila TaxID=3050082 RepID=A0ABU3Q9T9_9SPHN|nr:MoaD/ThiS family protein [Sphingosinicella sp. GR2756]MDT9599884.1 MoaD/ThiS family protein [Sphingosinicella sp. GR2756]
MKILFFGRLGDMVGRETHVEVPPETRTVADLRQLLAQLHPAASEDLSRPSLRACVNDLIVGENYVVADSETVEFFPPLSGG